MTTFAYTGHLTDIGMGSLVGWHPLMVVEPVVEAFGPDGLVSKVPVEVAIQPGGGFSMTLIPSGELTPASGGSPGVDYVIKVGRYEIGDDLIRHWHGNDLWQFTAAAGGGNVGEMKGASLLAVWVGPPVNEWPPEPLPKGLYLDPITGDGFLEQ